MPRPVRVTSVIRFDRSAALSAAGVEAMHRAVDESAANIQTRASQTAPVDTGALRASIYVTNGSESDYNQRVSQARGLKHDAVILDEMDPQFVISPSSSGTPGPNTYIVIVGVAVEHGAPNEFGTRFMRAQPFLTPAVLGEEGTFNNAMSHILD
jgi:HK97 gp10 family phage protein